MADTAVAASVKEEQPLEQKPAAEPKQEESTETTAPTETDVKAEPAEEHKTNGNGEAKMTSKDVNTKSEQRPLQPVARRVSQLTIGPAHGRRTHKDNGQNGIRSSYEDLPESNDPDEICRQVDFYFSDSNLPTDKYLLRQTGGHENKPFPLKEIHSFKRMRHFQPFAAVLDAVKQSKILDITDDGMITRKTPLSDKFTFDIVQNKKLLEDENMPRSIYAKGFGEEHSGSQTEIEDFFKVFGDVNAVRLRRYYPGNNFKGSVFVEFADEKTAQDFLALETKPTFKGKELLIKPKQQYCDEKIEEIKSGKVKPNYQRDHSKGGDRDNWKSRRDHDQKNSRGRDRGGRDRGGRGRGRGGNRGERRQDRNRSAERKAENGDAAEVKAEVKVENTATNDEATTASAAAVEVDTAPIKSEPEAAATTTAAAAGGADAGEVQTNGKKRAREEDGDGEGGADDGGAAEKNKKVKTDE